MIPPTKLNEFFTIVDDFLKKTFRNESTVFVAVKTWQYSESFPLQQPFFLSAPPADVDQTAAITSKGEEEEKVTKTPNSMYFSPRLIFNRDGTCHGKVKLHGGVLIPQICRFEQGLAVNSEGVVSGSLKVGELFDGLEMRGRLEVNTIASPSKDVWSIKTDYQRRDFYSSFNYQRNGLGSSDFLVDCGTKFFNLLAGAGYERQKVSYLEQQDAAAQLDVMYAGLGFTGVDWSIGAKIVRANDMWSTGRIAFYQRVVPDTSVACAYNFDLEESRVHMSLGVSQGFKLRVPTIIQQRACEQVDAWTAILPFVGAFKVESTGLCAATIRGVFNGIVHWGLVVQRNMLVHSGVTRFGVTLSVESD
uniref:Uncharacterized protein n=1 Tax=Trypanosoma congolense (strain IL3000) TaxID=1068625 RepID=G0UKX8_TRYCI|nr:conserved hypothetical protein [Trypanosoma congolense IL3000]